MGAEAVEEAAAASMRPIKCRRPVGTHSANDLPPPAAAHAAVGKKKKKSKTTTGKTARELVRLPAGRDAGVRERSACFICRDEGGRH